MRFQVGAWVYRVRIVSGLSDEDGRSLDGRCSAAAREIQIDSAVPPGHRLAVLLHELAHAWAFHLPPPGDPEQRAEYDATMMGAVHQQLDEQGGQAALMGLEATAGGGVDDRPQAEPTANPPELPCPPANRAARCRCGRGIGPGSILTEARDALSVGRAMYCDACGTLTRWAETVNARGNPTGELARGPVCVSGPETLDWLRRHGQTAGVMVREG